MGGPFRLSALFGSRMCEQEEGGSIINVSTNATHQPTVVAAVYGGAKSALNYFTKVFAQAYGPKVRINCIVPGPFLTDISKAWDIPAGRKNWKAGSALMRAGRPDEVV